MEFSSVKGSQAVFGLVVGWVEGSAWRVVDLATGSQFHVGERSFESDPWWQRIA